MNRFWQWWRGQPITIRAAIIGAVIAAIATISAATITAIGQFLFKSSSDNLSPANTPISAQICPTPIFFQNVFRVHAELGCPIRASTGDIGFQEFEHGLMIWRKHPSSPTIYALLYDARHWISIPDPGGPPGPSCSEAEQNNERGPIFGFGRLWCEPWNWKSFLGLPTDKGREAGVNQIVDFEFGTILYAGEAGGFILHSDSSWESFPSQ